MTDLHVNFSDEELASEARTFEVVPTGSYYTRITNIDLRASTSEKNNGKPYWNVELTIQDGAFEGRKLWANVMLFDGALYSLVQLMKATGHEASLKTGKVPTADELISAEVITVVQKVRDKYKEQQAGDGEALFKSEVKGFKKYDGTSPSAKGAQPVAAGGKQSLLP